MSDGDASTLALSSEGSGAGGLFANGRKSSFSSNSEALLEARDYSRELAHKPLEVVPSCQTTARKWSDVLGALLAQFALVLGFFR